MSKDIIYREDAIKTLQENVMFEFTEDEEWATTCLQNLPSADRPQGKWKAKSFHEFFCDNCGFSFDMMKCDFLENMKFCPNCGARKGADDGTR